MSGIDYACAPSADEEFVCLFRNRVACFIRTRTHDPDTAQDLTQDVLLAVVRAVRRQQLRNPNRLAAFIYGTARNIVNSHVRSRSRHRRHVPIDSDDWSVSDVDPIEGPERKALVRRALSTLDSRDRQILSLTLVSGLTAGEIATRIGVTSEAIRARRSRALKKVTEQVRKLSRTIVLAESTDSHPSSRSCR